MTQAADAKYRSKLFEQDIANLREITNEELIDLCKENNRKAWNEFFRRFIPDIKKAIRYRLLECGYNDKVYSQDVLWDIHEKIVLKLCTKGILHQCTNIDGIVGWLQTIARNQTNDWLNRRSRKKRLPQRQSEQSMKSISEPVKKGTDLSLENMLPAEQLPGKELRENIEFSLNKITNLKNLQKKWVLRLSILHSLPLTFEEFEELSIFCNLTINELKNRIAQIVLQVQKREEKRIQALGKAVLLWHEIRNMEKKLDDVEKGFLKYDQKIIDELNHDINKKLKNRDQCLERGQRYSKPSNRDIAKIIGLPENKINQVSTILDRDRECLK